MDRALWFLIKLQLLGRFRRFSRGVRSLKGALLVLVGLLVFVPWLFAAFVLNAAPTAEHLELVRQHAPLFLLGLFITTVLSNNEYALTYSPAETGFLFSGPFRPRDLLVYKVVGNLVNAAFASFFMALMLSQHAGSILSAYVGMFLALVWFSLLAMALILASQRVIALDSRWRRWLVVAVLAVVAILTMASVGREVLELPFLEAMTRVENAPAMKVVLAPFRVLAMTFTAERIWPDLVLWGLASLAANLALLVLVLLIQTPFVEVASDVSARSFARLQRFRRGGGVAGLSTPGKLRFEIPMLPFWGGAGAVGWRQLTTASRGFAALLTRFALFAIMVVVLVFVLRKEGPGQPGMLMMTAIWMVFFLTQILTYDFRGDLDRIAALKSLPISSTAVAAGELITPVALATAYQLVLAGLLMGFSPSARELPWSVLLWLVPGNFVLFGLENLLYLWFPTRTVAQATSIQAIGRQIVMMLAKLVVLGVAFGASGMMGLAASWMGWPRELVFALPTLVLMAEAVVVVMLLGLAFERFDVSRDIPG